MIDDEGSDRMEPTIRKSDPMHVRIARDLGVEIVTGVLPPGTILPSELAIAHQRGVSRSVIREALRMLSAKRLVVGRPRAGTRVCERSEWHLLDPELLGWMSEGKPPAGFRQALFELCMILEPAAAELAAVNRTARHLSLLGHALEQMATSGHPDPVGEVANRTFNRLIFEATGNELLVKLSSSLAIAAGCTKHPRGRKQSGPRDRISLYRDLFKAIANADPTAARTTMVTLITQGEQDMQTGHLPRRVS